uniref:Efflux RND transporter periplasmic adaptor subunit n=1 Tax=Acidobacterium capsulatum TaxID=33075 RepID=A0A7V4XTB5_9BACT
MNLTRLHARSSFVPRTLALLAGLAALQVIAGCSKAAPAPPAVVSVQAATASLQPLTEHITADAVLAPISQAAIAPKITAPVKRFYVQRGAHVHRGELLATLDNADLQAAVQDNQGVLLAQQANYDSTVKATVPQAYEQARLNVAQTKANLDLNQDIVKSRKKLYAQGAIPGRELDTSEAALVQAQTAYDAALKVFDGMKQVSREAALRQARGQLESAQGLYAAAKAQLSYSEIRSPIDGVVTDRPLYAGETATAGSALLTVMDTSVLIAKLHIPQPQAQALSVGNTATVQVPGMLHPVDGKVTIISPALDPGSTTVEIWVEIKNPDGDLRPGTAVTVTMAGRHVQHALVVPSDAIVLTTTGKKSLMVIGSNNIAHQVIVKTGIKDDGKTQILSGISAGQRVVTTGAYGMDDGTKVKVVPGSSADSSAGGQG